MVEKEEHFKQQQIILQQNLRRIYIIKKLKSVLKIATSFLCKLTFVQKLGKPIIACLCVGDDIAFLSHRNTPNIGYSTFR